MESALISVWENIEGVLSRPVAEWAGLGDTDPHLGSRALADLASHLNDAGTTFAEIADLIDGGAS